jgi:hypothetical protein
MSRILNAIKNLAVPQTKRRQESTRIFYKTLNHQKYIGISHLGGPIILTRLVQIMAGYDPNNNAKKKVC